MKQKTVFYCTECGNETMKWQGRCSACGAWNTIVEQPRQIERPGAAGGKTVRRGTAVARPMAEVESSEEIRFSTGLGELDRVLGGGAVIGSLVLVGGAPGIGKSTLMLQICDHLPATVLYVSGEESERQLKLRADRLGIAQDKLYVLSATGMDDILAAAEELKPEVLIVDSIQTTYDALLTSPPGSVGQVRACTAALMELAKRSGITVFVVGHVTKEGAIAGPRILEHMVDCVLYFEGDQHMLYRILRAVKNRFGATNEIGVFAMEERGLTEVPNPSQALLSARPANTPGTCVTCVMEGARPILAEIQALLAPTSFSAPRRMSNGVDYNRVVMLLAVLEKRGGLAIGSCDAYLNVVGGLTLEEPSADLATVLALASSFLDRPLPQDLAAIGEVGLTGELRAVSMLGQRISEAHRLSFRRCIVPGWGSETVAVPDGLQLIRVRNIREAIDAVLLQES